MKKRFFSLIEILIALALSSILFTLLLSSYFQAQYAALLVVKEERERFPEKYLLHRLSEVFLNLSQEVDQTSLVFYTFDLVESKENTPALLFSYENGMVLSPALSGNVLGLLFLDKEGDLTLITWPARENWVNDNPPKMHREVLWPQVDSLQFNFFYLPENQGESGKSPSWIKGQWPKDLKGGPAAIEILLEPQNKRAVSFLFPVPSQLALLREKK